MGLRILPQRHGPTTTLVPKWRLQRLGQGKTIFTPKGLKQVKFLHPNADKRSRGVISPSVVWEVNRVTSKKGSTNKHAWLLLGAQRSQTSTRLRVLTLRGTTVSTHVLNLLHKNKGSSNRMSSPEHNTRHKYWGYNVVLT